MSYDKNHLGTPVKDIIVSVKSGPSFIVAEPFITAMRSIKTRAPMVHCGIDEWTPCDLFVMQIAKVFKDSSFSGSGGPALLLPDDVMEMLHPGWVKDREEARAIPR